MSKSNLISALVQAYEANEESADAWRNRDGQKYGCGPAYVARCAAIKACLEAYGYRLAFDGYGLSAAFDTALAQEREIPEALWPESAFAS